jgi:hypothetical protein
VLDNETNKLMLEADSLQTSEEKYKLSYYEIELKASLASYSSSNDDDKWRLFTKQLSSRQHVLLLLCRERQYFCKDSTW